MPIEFTRKGYIEVWKDDVFISRHVSELEAIESLSEHGDGEYEIRSPTVVVTVNWGLVGGVSPPPVVDSSDPYDLTLNGTRTVPNNITVVWPSAPNTGGVEVTASTAASVNSNISSGARKIIVQTGSYGTINVGGTDVDLEFEPGVNITNLNVTGSATRCRLTWQVPRSGQVQNFALPEFGSKPVDILVDGMNMQNGNARVYLNGDRVAVINSRLDVGTGTFSAFVIPQGTSPCQDTIIANCELVGPGTSDANARFQGTSQLIFADNRMAQGPSGTYNTWRLHTISYDGSGTSMNAWIAGNQFEGTRLAIIDQCCGTSAVGGPHYLQNIYFDSNNFYMTAFASFGVAINTMSELGGDFPIQYLELTNNNLYSDAASAWITPTPDVESGNTTQAYDAPPAWSFA